MEPATIRLTPIHTSHPSGLHHLVAQQLDGDDPAAAGWRSEVLSDAAGRQLKLIASAIEAPARIDDSQLGKIAADDFHCGPLWPATMQPVFEDASFTVHREAASLERSSPAAGAGRGPAALAAALERLLGSGGAAGARRARFKLFGIDQGEKHFTTRAYAEVTQFNSDGAIQQNSVWTCSWMVPAADQPPRLREIEVTQCEEVRFRGGGETLFVDCTEALLSQNDCYRQQILPGIEHWLRRISKLQSMTRHGYHGLAIGDVNGDGLDDVYMLDAGGLPNRLFVQNDDGTATDRGAEAGVDWLEYCTAALFVDLDNDSDQDLIVASRPMLLIARNNGQGKFAVAMRLRLVGDPHGISAADYDQDGDLDIYICGYSGDGGVKRLPTPIPFRDAANGGRNVLLKNEGQFRFSNATKAVGLDQDNTRFSFAAAWEDYDNDGDMDLYVANDFGRNCLYRNDAGRFTNVAAQAGVEDIATGMSVSWGDFNRDGALDLYVGNMFSAAGNRVTYQRQFAHGKSDDFLTDIQRMTRGNTLFENSHDGTFVDVSEQADVTMGRWAWASRFADLNNDGWQDLLVANGFVSTADSGDL